MVLTICLTQLNTAVLNLKHFYSNISTFLMVVLDFFQRYYSFYQLYLHKKWNYAHNNDTFKFICHQQDYILLNYNYNNFLSIKSIIFFLILHYEGTKRKLNFNLTVVESFALPCTLYICTCVLYI